MKQKSTVFYSILGSVLVTQQIAGQYNYCGPRNVLFLIDQSSSVNRLCLSMWDRGVCEELCEELDQHVDTCIFDYFSTQKEFVKEAAGTLDISEDRTNVGIIRFSSSDLIRYDVRLGEWPSYDQESLLDAIDPLPYEMGSTHTRLALESAGEFILHANSTYNDYGDDEWFIPVHNLIVLITDGSSNDGTNILGRDDPTPVAQYLRRQGVDIITIGIGSSVNLQELWEISGNTNHTHQVSNFELSDFTNVIYDDLCPKGILDAPAVTGPEAAGPEAAGVEPKPAEEETINNSTNNAIPVSNPNNPAIVDEKSDNTGAIIGAVVGTLVAVLLVASGGVIWYRNKKRNESACSKLSDDIQGGNVLQNPLHSGEGQTSFVENKLYGRSIL